MKNKLLFIILLPIFLAGCSGGGSEDSPTVTLPEYTGSSINFQDPGIVFSLNFDTHNEGVYTKYNLDADFYGGRWSSVSGVDEGRVYIVTDNGNKVMRVTLLKDQYGHQNGGIQWGHYITGSHDELYISYKVKFGDAFDFVDGGKLPGLAGGLANSGGNPPDGADGWSVRLKWQKGGGVVQYVYHPDQSQNFPYGDEFSLEYGGSQVQAVPGTWYYVETRVRLNTPGSKDGLIHSWLNGVMVLDKQGLRFRDISNLHIDIDFFGTFFGGNDASFAPKKDEYIYIDDFVISRNRITH
jgi:hypothetical protein